MDILYHSIQLLYQIFKNMDWKHKKSETILYLSISYFFFLLFLGRTLTDKAPNKSVRMECASGNLLRVVASGETLEQPRQ